MDDEIWLSSGEVETRRLIELQDCSHIFDVQTLDIFMKTETETIQIPQCPVCRKPIVNTYRYKDMINNLLRSDINRIKQEVYGTQPQRALKRVDLLRKSINIETAQRLAFGNGDWKHAYEVIVKAIREANKLTSLQQLKMYQIYLDDLEKLGQYYAKYIGGNLNELKAEMLQQVKMLCTVLVTNKQKISQQQQADIENEMKRLNSIIQLATIRNHVSYKVSKSDPRILWASVEANEAVLSWGIYDEDKAVQCLKELQDAIKVSPRLPRAGRWYKCQNGHFNCIGEFGAALQLPRCVECGGTLIS